MTTNPNESEWEDRLSGNHWTQWNEEERAYFSREQEDNSMDPRAVALYSRLCHALEAIRLEILEPTSETGVVDFDEMLPLVSDWSRKTAIGVLRVLVGSG